MPHDWEERDEMAAGTICPVSDCGALAVAYRPLDQTVRDNAEPWEFTCPRCGIDFIVWEGDLIFHSVPKDWLLAKAHVG
jgi:hypothetical protein